MSREVDERVVQMQFDNAQFERGTRQTMGTLEKLKQSLQFKGVEKGFERISSASQKVDFSEMTKALESIESKFSAVNVIAVTALTNITNKAIATGERLVKALSLDPIISGFQEYETQINAVQTILANTSSKGTTLDQVNAALDELNHYADLTIYNFTEMTRNIGTFTAAGVDLDTSVAAIKGIANLAAVSGSTSQQASTAMYQLSQALASGTVKLQDWNSVVNAGMGGQVFQDALKETARVHGVAIDSMIAKEGSFRETLSKGYMPKIASFIGKLFEDGGLLAGIGKVVMGLFGEGGALAGVGEAVMGVLTTIAAAIGITVPELGLIMLAIAAIGVAGFALIKNWDKVKEWFANFGEWISNLFQNIAEGIGNFVSNLVEGIGNVFKKIWEVGKNIGQGLWNGVTSVASGIWNGIKGLGSWIVNGFKSIFGIHSPSTVMAELGAYMGQGFANGITSTEDGVNRSMDDMTSSALDIATNAAQMLYDVATGQETAEPIFTPVLNLSDYASPTSWAATQAYTPSAETAERVYRSNELAQRIGGNQNGAFTKPQSDNSDVVNAISQLGNRVDRMAESISKMKLVLDSGKTVGELAPKIDSNMGGRNILAERGVI